MYYSKKHRQSTKYREQKGNISPFLPCCFLSVPAPRFTGYDLWPAAAFPHSPFSTPNPGTASCLQVIHSVQLHHLKATEGWNIKYKRQLRLIRRKVENKVMARNEWSPRAEGQKTLNQTWNNEKTQNKLNFPVQNSATWLGYETSQKIIVMPSNTNVNLLNFTKTFLCTF